MWLPRLIAVSAPTAWRRAKKFHYGQLYRDDDGRLCVKLEVVEHVEGCVFTDAQLAGTAPPNPTKRRNGRPRKILRLWPGNPIMPGRREPAFTNAQMMDYARECLLRRDSQWAEYLGGNFRLTARRQPRVSGV
jgi:hypothetical protein